MTPDTRPVMRITRRRMADGPPPQVAALQILSAWFSPGYPVGAYSYSHALEWTVEAGAVTDGAALHDWIEELLLFGAPRTDAILLCHTWRGADPASMSELAEALAPSRERWLETSAQGAAFAKTTAEAWRIEVPQSAYPVAVGVAARALALPLPETVALFVQAFAANIVSAGVRLIPLGQTEGQRITARLLPVAAHVANLALQAELEDVGGATVFADIASMLHETQYTRLYRS